MSTIKKSQAMMRMLKERLELRTFTSSIVESADAEGFPVLSLHDGTPAAGEKAYVIRIREIQPDASDLKGFGVDIFGNKQTIYTPHQVELVYEDVAANRAADALALLMSELSKLGAIIDIYENAGGNVAVAADLATDTSGDPTLRITPDLVHPLSGQ